MAHRAAEADLPGTGGFFAFVQQFSGEDSLFPFPVCRKAGTVWGGHGTVPAFSPGADTIWKARLSEPGSGLPHHSASRPGRPCRDKKRRPRDRTVLVFSGAGRRYLACSLSTSIIFFCGLIMQASMNSWMSESDFRMDFAVFWVLRFQASSQMMKPLASSGSSA